MLVIKPNCEHCDADLPNGSDDACICSYECTFCAACVAQVLDNVCPNCGGGFTRRPARPGRAWRDGVSAAHQPPSAERHLKPVDVAAHRAFAVAIKQIDPTDR